MPSVMKSKEPARFQAGREHDVVDVFVLAVRARSLVRGIAPERVDRLAHPREVSQSWITVDCGEADRQAELAEREPLLRGSPEIRLMSVVPVSYTHLRAHETPEHLVCRLLLE